MTTKAQCKDYMIEQLGLYPERYTDNLTGELDAFRLSEKCADHFVLYEADACQSSDTIEYIPDATIFYLADELIREYKKEHPWKS